MAEFNSGACRAELQANIKSNQHRLDELGKKMDNMSEIVICIREIAVEMKGMKETQDEIKRGQELLAKQIREVEARPAKKASTYIDKAVNAVIAALVAFIMANILNK